jgi:ABC-2 type transport system ATP-binding protein
VPSPLGRQTVPPTPAAPGARAGVAYGGHDHTVPTVADTGTVSCGRPGDQRVIEARELTKRYGDTLAVDRLSFDVRPGQVTGFLGPNGSGKSTTMRMVMGLDRPDGGHVTVGGRRYHDLPWPLREVGGLLESKAIHPGRSAYNHLRALAQTNDIPASRVGELLELVGLAAVGRKRAGKFSLGMTQRLGIAAALLGDPGVLLFDEPVNGLDPEGILWVRMLLKRLAAEGRAVFVSSHLMSEMALTADHLVVIGRGRLIADQPVAEFVAQSSRATVRVRTPSPAPLTTALVESGAHVDTQPDGALVVSGLAAAAVGDLAAGLGIALHELSPHAASLEEAFMELTQGSVEFRAEDGTRVPVDRPLPPAEVDAVTEVRP